METHNSKSNQPSAAQVTRVADILFLSGTGFVAFGIWSIAKSLFYFWMDGDYFQGLYDTASELQLIRIVLSIILLIDLLLRVYVARGARKESAALMDASNNRKPRILYLVVAGIITIGYLASLPLEVNAFLQNDADLFDVIPALIVELTCIYIAFQLFSSAILTLRYRKLRERQNAN